MPMHLHRMVIAELKKILTRFSGWAGIALSATIPLIVVAVLLWIRSQTTGEDGLVVNNSPISQMVAFEVYTVMDWALSVRNFLVLPLMLLMITAQLVAGEWKERTLRSILVRPVPRWSVLTAKFLAVLLYSGACLLITWILAFAPSVALFDFEAEIADVSLGYLASWGTDAGFIAIGMLVSTIFPSVVGVVVGTALGWGFELAIRGGLKAASFFGVEQADKIGPWMPGNALDAWQGFSGGWDERAFGGLAILVVLSTALAIVRFSRTDVP